MPLAQLSARFQSLPPLPKSKLGPSGVDSQVGGFVYFLGPCGSNELSCEAGIFSHCRNPYNIFQSEVLRLYFPTLESCVAWSVSLPSCSSPIITHKCGTSRSASHHLALPGPPAAALPGVLSTLAAHLCPSYRSG